MLPSKENETRPPEVELTGHGFEAVPVRRSPFLQAQRQGDAEGPPVRVVWLWVWVVSGLLMSGCQPYLDHEVTTFSARPESAGLGGPRRKLQLEAITGDEQSLLLTFNQPLRVPGDVAAEVPFRPRLTPAGQPFELQFDGLASVRVRFAAPLPMASDFQLELPSGWRAATGMAFSAPLRQRWSTPRPELLSVSPGNGPSRDGSASRKSLALGEPLLLTFNQPVVPGSVEAALIWERLDEPEARPEPVRLEALPEEPKGSQRRFLMRQGTTRPGTYRLTLEPGVRAVQGPLRGRKPSEFLVEVGERSLNYSGPGLLAGRPEIELEFSEPVDSAELSRCLICLPSGTASPTIETGEGKALLRFPGAQPDRLVLTAGLRARDGSVLQREIELQVGPSDTPQEVARSRTRLASDQFYYPSGATIRLAALMNLVDLPEGQVALTLRDDAGKVRQRTAVTAPASGLLVASLEAPSQPGRYTIGLDPEAVGGSLEVEVAPVAEDGERYEIAWKESGAALAAVLSREGGRRRKVALRAYLRPSVDEPPPGWERTSGFAPAWIALGSTLETELPVPSAGLEMGGELVVEAFDQEQPDLVVARQTRPVEGSAVGLSLLNDPDQPGGVRARLIGASAPAVEAKLSHEVSRGVLETVLRASAGELRASWRKRGETAASTSTPAVAAPLELDVGRSDGVRGDLRAGSELRLRLRGERPGSAFVLLSGPELEGWSREFRSSFAGRPQPVSRPLLPPHWPSSGDAVPWQEEIAESGECRVAAPTSAGPFRWRVLGRAEDGSPLSAEAVASLTTAESWSAFAPPGARLGDSFQAGVLFRSAPDQPGALGLTATALTGQGWLAPTGYLRTDRVLKGAGSSRLPFSYRLDTASTADPKMAWQLGHGGELHPLERELTVFPTEPLPLGEGRASLLPSALRHLPVRGDRPWRLQLLPPVARGASSWVSVSGASGSLGKVHLLAGAAPVWLQGAGPGTLHLTHLQGAAVSYEMFRLEPDLGLTIPWGERFYLFRELLDSRGGSAASMSVASSEESKIRLTLVAPEPIEALSVHLPLPGGVRALSLEPSPDRPATPQVDWSAREGEVRFELDSLSEGEYVWEIAVEAVSEGDFLWPTARGFAGDGSLQALSGSSRLTISP